MALEAASRVSHGIDPMSVTGYEVSVPRLECFDIPIGYERTLKGHGANRDLQIRAFRQVVGGFWIPLISLDCERNTKITSTGTAEIAFRPQNSDAPVAVKVRAVTTPIGSEYRVLCRPLQGLRVAEPHAVPASLPPQAPATLPPPYPPARQDPSPLAPEDREEEEEEEEELCLKEDSSSSGEDDRLGKRRRDPPPSPPKKKRKKHGDNARNKEPLVPDHWEGEPEVAGEGEHVCSTCMERAAAAFFDACRHCTLCIRCARENFKKYQGKCPICRKPFERIKKYERVYFC